MYRLAVTSNDTAQHLDTCRFLQYSQSGTLFSKTHRAGPEPGTPQRAPGLQPVSDHVVSRGTRIGTAVSLLVRARARCRHQARRAGSPGENLPPGVEPVAADLGASGVSESGVGLGRRQRPPAASAAVDLPIRAT